MLSQLEDELEQNKDKGSWCAQHHIGRRNTTLVGAILCLCGTHSEDEIETHCDCCSADFIWKAAQPRVPQVCHSRVNQLHHARIQHIQIALSIRQCLRDRSVDGVILQ